MRLIKRLMVTHLKLRRAACLSVFYIIKHCCPVNFSELPAIITLSRIVYIYNIRDINWNPLPETRCKYVHVRSNAASMRHTVSGDEFHSMPLTVNGAAVVCNIY